MQASPAVAEGVAQSALGPAINPSRDMDMSSTDDGIYASSLSSVDATPQPRLLLLRRTSRAKFDNISFVSPAASAKSSRRGTAMLAPVRTSHVDNGRSVSAQDPTPACARTARRRSPARFRTRHRLPSKAATTSTPPSRVAAPGPEAVARETRDGGSDNALGSAARGYRSFLRSLKPLATTRLARCRRSSSALSRRVPEVGATGRGMRAADRPGGRRHRRIPVLRLGGSPGPFVMVALRRKTRELKVFDLVVRRSRRV